MKNLKRTAAAFVSAILVMALLVGCGSSSSSSTTDIVSRLRSIFEAEQSDSLDKVAEALADVTLTENSAMAALIENGYYTLDTPVCLEDGTVVYAPAVDSYTNCTRLDSITIYKLAMTEDELLDYFSGDETVVLEALEELEQTVADAGYSDVKFYVAVRQIDSESWIVVVDGAIFL